MDKKLVADIYTDLTPNEQVEGEKWKISVPRDDARQLLEQKSFTLMVFHKAVIKTVTSSSRETEHS